ncbi:unnamed protein product [Phytophthora lilii]|uniref:Unnamed protein product n=1 Tax=Phytophthora lilii TaxID=2077276 RepID=A0A9W6TU15_9STRA|nr:unnamed protein product [Phytophthora lilii]
MDAEPACAVSQDLLLLEKKRKAKQDAVRDLNNGGGLDIIALDASISSRLTLTDVADVADDGDGRSADGGDAREAARQGAAAPERQVDVPGRPAVAAARMTHNDGRVLLALVCSLT